MNDYWRPTTKHLWREAFLENARQPLGTAGTRVGPDWSEPPTFRFGPLRGVFGRSGLSHLVNDDDVNDIVVFGRESDPAPMIAE